MNTGSRIALARKRVGRVLSGESTAATDPTYFDDDQVLADVAVLERHDLAWVLAALGRKDLPLEQRRWVAGMLRQPEARRRAAEAVAAAAG